MIIILGYSSNKYSGVIGHTSFIDQYTIWWETFEVENFRGSVRSEHFCGENFRGILNQSWVGMARQKFRGENFRGWLSNCEIHECFHPSL